MKMIRLSDVKVDEKIYKAEARITAEEKKMLDEVCRRTGRTRTELIKEAILKAYNELPKEEKPKRKGVRKTKKE